MSNPRDLISLKNPWHLFATGFGSGLAPFIPGTIGTLAAVPFYYLLVSLPFASYMVAVVFFSILGLKICKITSNDMKVHDHGSIVWDEFCGFWLTMAIVPLYKIPVHDWRWVVAGFVLFRFFDMLKPWPISWLDKNVHGGFGIMVDDLAAGALAAVSLFFVGFYAGWMPY